MRIEYEMNESSGKYTTHVEAAGTSGSPEKCRCIVHTRTRRYLPRSLFLVMAAAALALGPCWVKWYPNFTMLLLLSSILAISISVLVPSCCLYGDKRREGVLRPTLMTHQSA